MDFAVALYFFDYLQEALVIFVLTILSFNLIL